MNLKIKRKTKKRNLRSKKMIRIMTRKKKKRMLRKIIRDKSKMTTR
jgi:hypothetical protein